MSERRPASTMHEGGRVSGIQVKGKQTNKQTNRLLSALTSQNPAIWLAQTQGHLNVFCCSMGLMESLCLEQMNEFSKIFFLEIHF